MAVAAEIKTKFTLDGLREVQSRFGAFKRSMSDTLNSVKERGARVFAPLHDGLTKVQSKTTLLATSMARLGKDTAFRGIRIGAYGAAAAVGLVALKVTAISAAAIRAAKDTSAMLDQLSKDSRRLGVSTEDLSVLGFAAEREGVNPEEVTKGLAKIGREFLTIREQIQKADGAYAEFIEGVRKDAQFAIKSGDHAGLLDQVTGFSAADLEARKGSLSAIQQRIAQIDADGGRIYASGSGRSSLADESRLRALQKEREDLVRAAADLKKAYGSSGEALFTLQNFGLDLERATKGGTDSLYAISDAFKQIQDPAEKVRVAVNLFGEEAGAQMITLLESGRSGIESYRKELERLGGVVSQADATLGADYQDSASNLQRALQGVRLEISRGILPSLIETNKQLTEWLVRSRGSIADYVKSGFDSLKAFVVDVIALVNGDAGNIQTKWLDSLIRKTLALRVVWDDVKKQIGLLFDGKETDYVWLNGLRDAFIQVKAFAVDAWAVASGGKATDFTWMNGIRDRVVDFTRKLGEALDLVKGFLSTVHSLTKPLFDAFGIDPTTLLLFVGMTKLISIVTGASAAFGLLKKTAVGLFSLGGGAAAAGTAAAGVAGQVGGAAATATGFAASLVGIQAAVLGIAKSAGVMGVALVGGFALGQAAAAQLTKGTQAAYEEVWKQQAALIQAQDRGRINELLKSRDPSSDDFRKRYWADKNVNIVTAAERAAIGVKKMDDFIGWKRADGIVDPHSASDYRRAAQQKPAAVFQYDIKINGRPATVTGDMNMKRALDEMNNGFS